MRWFKIKGEAEVQFSVEVLTCNILKMKKNKTKMHDILKAQGPANDFAAQNTLCEHNGNLEIIFRKIKI